MLFCTNIEDFFSKQNYRFYQRVGQVVSRAIVNVMLHSRVKKQDEFTSLMDEIDSKLKHKDEKEALATTLDYCLGSLIELLGAERSSLMCYDSDKKELRVLAAKGFRVYPISGMPIRWGEGIAGLALKEAKIISIPKMREPMRSGRFSKLIKRESLPETRIKSLLCLPITRSEKPLGVINVSTINFYKSFEPSEIEMADNVVSRISDIVSRLSETEPARELIQ
jgi:signal transduction protein with GAF and PtsI domain